MRDEVPTRVYCGVTSSSSSRFVAVSIIVKSWLLGELVEDSVSLHILKKNDKNDMPFPKPHEFVPLGLSSRDVKDLYPAVEPLIMKRPQFE